MNLLPFLAHLLEEFPDISVLAAGGIASGRTLAAVLAAGAEGAWLGTAFLATPEAVEVPDGYKELIVQSDGQNTVYTQVYDILNDRLFGIPEGHGWPPGIAARVHNNRMAREWHGREDELRQHLDEVMPLYVQAQQRHDVEAIPVYMGQSAASVDAVRPAAEVLRRICDEAERILRERPRALFR